MRSVSIATTITIMTASTNREEHVEICNAASPALEASCTYLQNISRTKHSRVYFHPSFTPHDGNYAVCYDAGRPLYPMHTFITPRFWRNKRWKNKRKKKTEKRKKKKKKKGQSKGHSIPSLLLLLRSCIHVLSDRISHGKQVYP